MGPCVRGGAVWRASSASCLRSETIRFPRLTYSRVVSTLALFVALGGTGYAAVSINGRSIQDHSIPARKLARNAVVPRAASADALRGVTIRSNKLLDIPPGLTATRFATCRRGEVVLGGGGAYESPETSEPGHFSPASPLARTGVEDARDRIVQSNPFIISDYVNGAGERTPNLPLYPDQFRRDSRGGDSGLQGWTYHAQNNSGEARTLHVFAICVKAGA